MMKKVISWRCAIFRIGSCLFISKAQFISGQRRVCLSKIVCQNRFQVQRENTQKGHYCVFLLYFVALREEYGQREHFSSIIFIMPIFVCTKQSKLFGIAMKLIKCMQKRTLVFQNLFCQILVTLKVTNLAPTK